MNETLQTVAGMLASSVVIIGAVAWVARAVLSQVLSRDLERFKSELATASLLAAERTRHELQITAHERGLLLTKLHEKRAQVISELYELLVEAQWSSQDFASPVESSGQPSKGEKLTTALNKFTDFYRFFEKSRIYLPAQLCSSLEGFSASMRSKVVEFGVHVLVSERVPDNNESSREKLETWFEVSRYFNKEVPAAREALETELRHLIGVVEPRS